MPTEVDFDPRTARQAIILQLQKQGPLAAFEIVREVTRAYKGRWTKTTIRNTLGHLTREKVLTLNGRGDKYHIDEGAVGIDAITSHLDKIGAAILSDGPLSREEMAARTDLSREQIHSAVYSGVRSGRLVVTSSKPQRFGLPGKSTVRKGTHWPGISDAPPEWQPKDAEALKGWNLIETRRVPLIRNKALIREFAEMEPCPGDRDPKKARDRALEFNVRLHQFEFNWIRGRLRGHRKWFRLNGKTSSTMLLREPDLVKKDSLAVVSSYEFDSEEDMKNFYKVIDLFNRGPGDYVKAACAGVPEFDGIPVTVLTSITSGLAYALYGQHFHSRIPAYNRSFLPVEYKEFSAWAGKLIAVGRGSTSPVSLKRPPIIAVMYLTWLKSRKQAREFWKDVQTGDSPMEMPDRALFEWLRDVRSSRGRSVSGETVKDREFFVRCIHCWNAFREDRTVKRLAYYANSPIPPIK